jgi:predicted Zn-dependent protease
MKKILTILFLIFLISCETVPVSERKQLILLPDSYINKQSAKAYQQFLSKANVVSKSDRQNQELQVIAKNIENAIHQYFILENKPDPTKKINWDVNLVKEEQVNAWAMPGGKITFYTKILEIAENKDGIAAIMAHEMAHVIGRHGNERMSQALLLDVATTVAQTATGTTLQGGAKTTYNLLRAYGIFLPFGRKQETESDYLGLIFMTIAGYDPEETIKLWERMGAHAKKKGGSPPEFMSTHPSSENRIENFKKWIPIVRSKYSGYQHNYFFKE